MKGLTFCILILLSFAAYAQIHYVEIGINGLTCSMCSYSVENSLKRNKAVQEVKMDLNNNVARVLLRQGAKPDFSDLAAKVKEAGFSVGFFRLSLTFPDTLVINDKVAEFGGYRFLLGNPERLKKSQVIVVNLIGKEFMSKELYKKEIHKFRNLQKKTIAEKNQYLVIVE